MMKKIEPNDPQAKSADLIAENVEKLKSLFPELVTEGPEGLSVNVDVLKALVGDQTLTDCDEKYGLNWHGKRRARQLALTPSTGTLRPAPEESEHWDTTQNIFIEGDNLEVLKLLQKSYAGRIKLIYIDPPYNTGKDFVYKDDFRDNIRNYKRLTGQVDEEGSPLTTNTESSGRFHTDWLNMMYPRLKLARNLLREDGVIFISIDDSEIANLRRVCDEVFGEENFCGTIKRRAARKTAFLSKTMSDVCDYVVIYSQGPLSNVLSVEQVKDNTRPVFNEGNKLVTRIIRAGTPAKCEDGLYAAGEYTTRSIGFTLHKDLIIEQGQVVDEVTVTAPWRVNQDILDKTLYITKNFGFRRYLLDEEKLKAKALSDLLDNPDCYNEKGTEILEELFESKGIFDTAKPIGLIDYLVRSSGADKNDIVLDFFAGSGTTGHAVMAQNAKDGGNRRYILVQLPEPLDPEKKEQKTAAEFCDQLGVPRTIAELTKERLRRAAKKIKEEHPDWNGDTGFRVFKLDSSNIKAWNPQPEDLESQLKAFVDHILPDRTEADLLYELLLKLGLDLCVPIETREIAGKAVHAIGGGVLMACLTERIAADEVEALGQGMVAWQKELVPAGDTTCVFRDSAFENDVAKTNLAAILEQAGIQNVRSL